MGMNMAARGNEMLADQAEFREKLKERMLQNELIDEVVIDDDNNFQTKRKSVMTDSKIADDIQAGTDEWCKEYDHHIQNPPRPGDILKASGVDAKVLLVVELAEKSPPFIYGRAFVPEIVGQPLGWYLQDKTDGQNFHGWKCILLPKARTELIRTFGLQSKTMEVKSLRVVRLSQSGKSLLCEVNDYGIEESKAEEPEVGVSEISSPEIAPSLIKGEAEATVLEEPKVNELTPADIDTVLPVVQDEEVTEDKVAEPIPEAEAQKPELTLGN